jgi:hypothetical protein
MFLICDSIRSETGNPSFGAILMPEDTDAITHRCPFVGSPSDSINLFAQLKNAALLITSTISASSRPTLRSSSTCCLPNAIGVEASATEGPDHGIPARAEIGAHAFIEQPLNIVAALGMDRREARVHGRAIDASVVAGCRRGREFALGPRQAVCGVVEDILVGLGPGSRTSGSRTSRRK